MQCMQRNPRRIKDELFICPGKRSRHFTQVLQQLYHGHRCHYHIGHFKMTSSRERYIEIDFFTSSLILRSIPSRPINTFFFRSCVTTRCDQPVCEYPIKQPVNRRRWGVIMCKTLVCKSLGEKANLLPIEATVSVTQISLANFCVGKIWYFAKTISVRLFE